MKKDFSKDWAVLDNLIEMTNSLINTRYLKTTAIKTQQQPEVQTPIFGIVEQ